MNSIQPGFRKGKILRCESYQASIDCLNRTAKGIFSNFIERVLNADERLVSGTDSTCMSLLFTPSALRDEAYSKLKEMLPINSDSFDTVMCSDECTCLVRSDKIHHLVLYPRFEYIGRGKQPSKERFTLEVYYEYKED